MFAINRRDAGTPPVNGAPVTLSIDGTEVTVPSGTSIMRAAAVAGGAIPKLCATETLKAYGSCRVCLVEVEGQKGYPASCTTVVQHGMKVRTQSDKLQQLRKGVVELYVSDHPLNCQGCPADSHCELQSVAADLGVTTSPYGFEGANHFAANVDASNPYFRFDPTLCIACSRCVR
ncbi:MAG: 2Fe-2S iron-sulfur cluster-binding protein, partial [Steroidobacteraceae bacterium]